MDDADIARRNDEFFRRMALANHRLMVGGAIIETHCIECGRRIPAKRLKACRRAGLGCTRCIECQALAEGRTR